MRKVILGLGIIGVTFIMILILLLMSSSLMYLVENEAQPDKFPHIPAAMCGAWRR